MLTEDQSKAATLIAEFLKSSDPFFLLSGSAGCGKTFLLSDVPNLIKNGKVIGCGPTHKSVEVLSGRLSDIETMTIHRFLGLRPKRTGDKTVLTKRNDYDPSSHFDVRVVMLDEASMVGTDILKYIVEDAETWDRKYIFVGDSYQLNPVNEQDCPVFNLDYGEWQFELNQIVRQAEGNPIITAATAIREAIKSGKQPDVVKGTSEGVGVHLLKRQAWIDKLSEHVDSATPDTFRVIAYRNDTVRDYNRLIRELKGLDTSMPFCKGEYVVVNEAYSRDEQVILNTGTEFMVNHMDDYTHPAFPELSGYTVRLEMAGLIIQETVNVLDYDKCGEAYKKQLAKLVENAKKTGDWRAYYRLVEAWCDLRPLGANTSHKSQGSTFDNVFVDYRDIYTNRIAVEADRSLYVAITRARHNVYVLF